MDTPPDRLQGVLAAIDGARLRAGRAAGSVRLLAVSKLQPLAAVRELYAAGQRDFGENYAQQLRDKAAEAADLPEIRWHAIGPLQLNKAKYVARWASSLHALDRLDVAAELGRRRQQEGLAPLPCFVEVKLADEPTKAGVSPDALPALLDALRPIQGVSVVGLMCMPPLSDDPRPHFARLRELAQHHGLPELSMGTTEDFELAIEEGATWVRVGRRLFGERP
jgi:pyridoxal phosphate enzyme (YggS family)